MLPKDWNRFFNESLVDFLWNQWTQLGVLGHLNSTKNWIIDPEALLLFSLSQSRYDARLFDEIFDWILHNERWISLQRLKGLSKQFDSSETSSILAALAGSIYMHTNNTRWKSLADLPMIVQLTPKPFFLTFDGTPIPVLNKYDENFESAGWLRSSMVPRSISMQVPFEVPGNLIIHLRLLFGITPRAEIIAFLLVNQRANASDLVKATGYSKPSIYDSLSDLVNGGYIHQQITGARSIYTLDFKRWEAFLNMKSESMRWIDWQRIFVAFTKLSYVLVLIQTQELSDYMLKSKLLSISKILNDGLVSSGLENPFAYAFTIDNVLTEFPAKLHLLMAELA
ncbi:MAG: hypothetical protein ACYCYM_10750 [Saccharofermentanales bacterium]